MRMHTMEPNDCPRFTPYLISRHRQCHRRPHTLALVGLPPSALDSSQSQPQQPQAGTGSCHPRMDLTFEHDPVNQPGKRGEREKG